MLVANWTNATEEFPSVSGLYTVLIDKYLQKDVLFLKAGEEILLKRTPDSGKLEEKVLYFMHKISLLIRIKTDGFYEIVRGDLGEKLVHFDDTRILWSSSRTNNTKFAEMKATVSLYKKEKESNDVALREEYNAESKNNALVEKVTNSLRKEMQDNRFTYAGIRFKVPTGAIKKSVIEATTIEKIIKSAALYPRHNELFYVFSGNGEGIFEDTLALKEDFVKYLKALQYPQNLVDTVADSMFSLLYSSRKEDIVRNLYCLEDGVPGTKEQETYLRALLKFSIIGSTRRFVCSYNGTDKIMNSIFQFNCIRDIAFYLTLQKSQIITFTEKFSYEMELED